MADAPIRRLVLDLLKPHDPTTVEFARHVAAVDGVTGVNAMVIEVDADVENLKLTVEGDDVDFDGVEAAISALGGSLHSVDEVACGDHLVEESETPQD